MLNSYVMVRMAFMTCYGNFLVPPESMLFYVLLLEIDPPHVHHYMGTCATALGRSDGRPQQRGIRSTRELRP